jgi:hypothetical protein
MIANKLFCLEIGSRELDLMDQYRMLGSDQFSSAQLGELVPFIFVDKFRGDIVKSHTFVGDSLLVWTCRTTLFPFLFTVEIDTCGESFNIMLLKDLTHAFVETPFSDLQLHLEVSNRLICREC